ncbi:MAG: hypothetical protein WD648_05790 [Planctomycetaceae bacterium]
MAPPSSPYLLPAQPIVDRRLADAVAADYLKFAQARPPTDFTDYVSTRYALDLRTEYAGCELTNPWGKASGQLSMTVQQIEEDVQAGLGFVVLKTVIAQDPHGRQSMEQWVVKESRMAAESVVGASGKAGWTINWKGRGWWQPFDEYLQLVRDARRIAQHGHTLIVPSCKYHLPKPDEATWNTAEYEYTTRQLLSAWSAAVESASSPMPLEKDFSPTLEGSDHAAVQANILEWLRQVPEHIATAVATWGEGTGYDEKQSGIRLGLKIFNALFDDEFQLEMLRTIHAAKRRANYFIYGNRLFDPNRQFEGHRGIAYGGPDLSDRNLRVMSRFGREVVDGAIAEPTLPWSATGNIATGKMALEYALQGASSFQLHTFFQLPSHVYAMKVGSKTQKALHELYFHPQTGLIVWMHHLAALLALPRDPIRLRDIIGRGTDRRLCRESK